MLTPDNKTTRKSLSRLNSWAPGLCVTTIVANIAELCCNVLIQLLQALQGFQGYAGGLDTLTGQSGSHTVVASYMSAKVCFKVTKVISSQSQMSAL